MFHSLTPLIQHGTLRVALNLGNHALVQMIGDVPHGMAPALASQLAQILGVPMRPIFYEGAGKVFQDASRDQWDVGFLAIDSQRAKQISYTRPYHRIEVTYAVRKGGPVTDVAMADRDGLSVLTAVGSAYDMYLAAHLKHAIHDRLGTPAESFAAFSQGRGDVVAGVRASLVQYFKNDPLVTILSGVVTTVDQAMVLPGPQNPLIGALDAFVAEALTDGLLAPYPG